MTAQTACYLTPGTWAARGPPVPVSCHTAVKHSTRICTSDWLTAGKVNLSPHTWTCFSTQGTLPHNKVEVQDLSTWFATHCHQDVTTRTTRLLDNSCRLEALRAGTDGTGWILRHALSELLPLAISLQQLHRRRLGKKPGWKKREHGKSNIACRLQEKLYIFIYILNNIQTIVRNYQEKLKPFSSLPSFTVFGAATKTCMQYHTLLYQNNSEFLWNRYSY